MGQQQLLLIVLGVIIVGIAVVVGINLFNANAEESTKDTLVSEGTNLGAMAQQYYKKPTALGGGGNSFTGWDENDVPANLINTPSGTWDITSNDTVCTIAGEPLDDLNYTWTITVTVTPTGISSTVVNP